jgi:hypothetical protein
MNSEVARIVPTKPDAELAAEFKLRMVELYKPLLELCTEAHAAGFEINVQSGMGPLGKHVITLLRIARVY